MVNDFMFEIWGERTCDCIEQTGLGVIVGIIIGFGIGYLCWKYGVEK